MKTFFKSSILAVAAILMSAVLSSSSVPNCPPGSDGVLLPHPDDCNAFYECCNGVAILQHCQEGMNFNAHLNCCDWPFMVDCNNNGGGNGSGGNNSVLWKRTDVDCEYSIAGKIGTTISILGGTVSLTIGADGTASYTYPGGKTECELGGLQQCQARYCPSIF